MSDQNKLYLISLLGITLRADPSGSEKQVARYVHVPLLMDAQSIEIVEEEACIQANRLFSKEHGFQTRHIAIQPVPREQYLRLLQLSHLSLLASSEEPVEQAVEFLCGEDSSDPDDTVIFEFNKLVS